MKVKILDSNVYLGQSFLKAYYFGEESYYAFGVVSDADIVEL